MKTINVVSYTNNLLTSLISLVIGVILFTRPELVVILISNILGGILVVIGILKIIYYSYQKGKNSEYPFNDILWAIILIILGCICIFLSSAVEEFVRFIIGMWILFSGINRLIKATELFKTNRNKSISVLIISVLLILVGGYVIFKSNLIISSLGIILIIYSILEILYYIFVVRNNHESVHTNETKSDVKVIITDEVTKKDPKKKKKSNKK
ncbi:MAG: DUF308 domain-containing protein [Bacilli bacterium]